MVSFASEHLPPLGPLPLCSMCVDPDVTLHHLPRLPQKPLVQNIHECSGLPWSSFCRRRGITSHQCPQLSNEHQTCPFPQGTILGVCMVPISVALVFFLFSHPSSSPSATPLSLWSSKLSSCQYLDERIFTYLQACRRTKGPVNNKGSSFGKGHLGYK